MVVGLVTAILPIEVLALGLGDIHTRSALNQYFDAEIELVSVKPGELDQVRAQLADTETFEEAGIERPHWLNQLRFEPKRLPGGRMVIHVTSREVVREPVVNFLLAVEWPQGRLLEEYTVLLDPPTGQMSGRDQAMPPPASRPSMPSGKTSPAMESKSSGSYGPIGQDETLWSIAQGLRRPGETTQQMAMALLAANPQAFAGHNVNGLLKGSVLRVPSPAEVHALSSHDAAMAFRSQLDQ
jgi:pilus assembly protein FimV